MHHSVNRIIIYTRKPPELAEFNQRFFGFEV